LILAADGVAGNGKDGSGMCGDGREMVRHIAEPSRIGEGYAMQCNAITAPSGVRCG